MTDLGMFFIPVDIYNILYLCSLCVNARLQSIYQIYTAVLYISRYHNFRFRSRPLCSIEGTFKHSTFVLPCQSCHCISSDILTDFAIRLVFIFLRFFPLALYVSVSRYAFRVWHIPIGWYDRFNYIPY